MKLWYPPPVCGRIHSVGGTQYERVVKTAQYFKHGILGCHKKPDKFMEWRKIRLQGKRDFRHYKCNMRERISLPHK
ncbi:hypothetical protein CEXT_725431 [Caerostris extrusa]|uniref:Uncharacterized protein n=1 Tax=Caerostris extrusa TaxID=172846 RepID=A0AAV4XN09_CAEEX|nr:hypothetical protein CEXT_725431 [Caerostris extrusa]